MIALTLALRNLWRNRRRSLATLAAVAVGFAAINLFAGYIHDVYAGITRSAIHGEGLGHLTIAKRGYFQEGSLHPERYQWSRAELARLAALLKAEPGVELVSPRLELSGLVSNGKLSTIFIAEAMVPADAARLWQGFGALPQLDEKRPDAGLMARGLAEQLGVKPGDTVVLLGSTLAGQTNALDLDIKDRWETGNAGTNDKALRLPLSYAQRLLDTDGASRLVVLFAPGTDAEAARARLAPKLRAAGFDVDIKTWVELSSFYQQVKNLFDLIFLFLFSIVFLVVLMSIVNTLSMNVMERVREIGTLRALGYTRGGIVRLFAVEGGVLGAVGCVLGVALTAAVTLAINGAHLSYVPPSSSAPVPLTVGWSPLMLTASLLILSLVAMLAAFWPARRAAHIEIVDALGHV